MEDLFRDYLAYVGESESPTIYHRWAAIYAVGTILGRSVYVSTSIIPIYPNNYVLLMGPPAARKSTALKYARNLLKKAGYKRMAPERMSRQAFINEMHAINQPEALGLGLEDILDMETDYPYEMSIAASEFVDFIGQHDKDYRDWETDRKSTRLNSSHSAKSRMPSSA